MNVASDTKKPIPSFNSTFYSYDVLSYRIVGLPGNRRKHPLHKIESIIAPVDGPIRCVLKIRINKTSCRAIRSKKS